MNTLNATLAEIAGKTPKNLRIENLRIVIAEARPQIEAALAAGHTYKEVREYLAANGIDVKLTTLSVYISGLRKGRISAGPKRRTRRASSISIDAAFDGTGVTEPAEPQLQQPEPAEPGVVNMALAEMLRSYADAIEEGLIETHPDNPVDNGTATCSQYGEAFRLFANGYMYESNRISAADEP